MVKTALLVCSNPFRLLRVFPYIQNYVQNTLYVHFYPTPALDKQTARPGFSVVDAYKNLNPTHVDVRVLLSGLKSGSLEHAPITTIRPVDLVFYDDHLESEQLRNVVSSLSNKSPNFKTVYVQLNDNRNVKEEDEKENESMHESTLSIHESTMSSEQENKLYENVVLGGTFDRLHNGHKILLSTAALKCTKKLIVGVTDITMLKSKKLWELIEPCSKRISNVEGFLKDIDPTLDYDILPIYDIYGPTIYDSEFELIVLSEETISGGKLINEKRINAGLRALDILPVPLLEEDKSYIDCCKEEEQKISSSNYRMRLLGSLLKSPEANNNIPASPYIIGLTGGIASGKSSIAEYLKEQGVFVINADVLGHELYNKGQPAYQSIINTFGTDVLDICGDVDRKKLGAIVFSNKCKLHQLNEIMWPLILQKVKEIIATAKNQNIVVLEAAVLIKAYWHLHCHEVWASIIPENEAIRRLQERNNLSEQEAQNRINSQPSNSEYVENASVIFSTMWSYDCTHIQVKRAWADVLKRTSQTS